MTDVDQAACGVGSRGQVAIMVSRRCNMTCAHCSVESGPKVAGADPDEATLLRWIREAADAGVRTIRLTGGEPMLRAPLVRRLFRECRRFGIGGAMTTNGFWGRNAFQAYRQLALLKRAGLTSMVVSYDKYHADFQGPAPVRNIAAAARRLGVPMAVTMVRSADDPPDMLDVLGPGGPETGARVRVYDLQPVGRGGALFDESVVRDVDGFCSAAAFPAVTEDGRVMACNGPAYFERKSSPLIVGSLAEATLGELIDRHERDVILDTIRTRGPAGLRDELRQIPGFENYPFRASYRGVCDLCHAITRDDRAVAALRERLARPELAAARVAAMQVILGNRSRGVISSRYVNGTGACRVFLRAAWQPEAPFDDEVVRVLGSAHLDWRRLATYLNGSGLARPLAPVLASPEIDRWAPPFFVDAIRQRGVSDGLRELVQRDVIGQINDILVELGARGVLLKGSALAVRTRSGRTPRATSDIDVLVDPAVGPTLRARLIERGALGEAGTGHDTYHHLEPVKCQGVMVEIHTRLMAGFWGLPERQMLDGAQPIDGWPALQTMTPEALAFHSVVHTSSSFYSYGLKTAWDLRVLAESAPGLDWLRLGEWAHALPAPRAFWVPLRLLAQELDLRVPDALVRQAPKDAGTRRLERVAAERLFRATDSFADLDAATKAGMMLLMHDRLSGKARYLAAKLWWRGTRPSTWGAALNRARKADLVRQAVRNYRRYKRTVSE